MISRSVLRQARESWRQGRHRECGQILYENMEPGERVRWGAGVLRAAAAHATSVPEVELILRIAWDPPRFREAQRALAAMRELTLRAQSNEALAKTLYVGLLCLAEEVARLIADAGGEPDRFGAETGAQLAAVAADVARKLPTAAAARIEDAVLEAP